MKNRTFKHVKTGLKVSIAEEIFPPNTYWYSDTRGQTYCRAMIEDSNDWVEIVDKEYSKEDLVKFANYCKKSPQYSPGNLLFLYDKLNTPKIEEESKFIKGRPLIRTLKRIAEWTKITSKTRGDVLCLIVEEPTEKQIQLLGAQGETYFYWTDELVDKFVKWLMPPYENIPFKAEMARFKQNEIDRMKEQ